MDKTRLLKEMDNWTVDARLEFIDAVFDRMAARGLIPNPDAQTLTILEERLAAHDADPSGVLSWDKAEARSRKRK